MYEILFTDRPDKNLKEEMQSSNDLLVVAVDANLEYFEGRSVRNIIVNQ